MKFSQVYNVVDSQYRLLWIGGEWDEFALQNAGSAALSNSVLATCILDHIADDDTRAATARIIDTVLATKTALTLDYRCDSPGMARKFLLTVQPMKEDRALMVHDLRDAWRFSPPLRPWRGDPEAKDCKCSYCGAIQFDRKGTWVRSDEVGEFHPTTVRYQICDACRGTIDSAISKTNAKADASVKIV